MSLSETCRRAALAALASLALFAAPSLAGPAQGIPQHGLRIEPLDIVTSRGTFHFQVDIADNPRSRDKGLMFVRALAPDHGMLFDFKTPHQVNFWMKNTLIPLDMIFIAPNGRILSIAHNAIPMSETPIPGTGPVLGVLELRGGRAAQIDAQPDDLVRQRMFHHG